MFDRFWRHHDFGLWLVIALMCVSCGKSGPELYPVSGKVLFEGQPAEGASVVFVSMDANVPPDLKPSGAVGADGSFSLETYPHGKGAPAGEYSVLVTWFPPNAREQLNPKSKLPAKYTDPTASGLKATVKAGSNELPEFQLKK